MGPILAMLLASPATAGIEVCVRPDRPLRRSDEAELSAVVQVAPAYRRARRDLSTGRLPAEPLAVADLVSHLAWDGLEPPADAPLSVALEAAPHPLREGWLVVGASVRGPQADLSSRPPMNVTFLLDASDSMRSVFTRRYPVLDVARVPFDASIFPRADRLDLARAALLEVVDDLDPRGTVAIAAYDQGAWTVLPPTPVADRRAIAAALDDLGSARGEGARFGIDLAVGLAEQVYDPCRDNRIVLLGDGGARVGGSDADIERSVARHASRGITVSALALGLDGRSPSMERLAWLGYGDAYYAEGLHDAAGALRRELLGDAAVLRDVRLELVGGDAVAVHPLADAPVERQTVPPGWTHTAVFEVDPAGAALPDLGLSWSASSPVPGEWDRTEVVRLSAVGESLHAASADLRVATGAALFGAWLAGDRTLDLEVVFGILDGAERGRQSDAELRALVALAANTR